LRSNKECLDRLERETTENVGENGPRPENRTPRNNVQPIMMEGAYITLK